MRDFIVFTLAFAVSRPLGELLLKHLFYLPVRFPKLRGLITPGAKNGKDKNASA